MSTNKSLEIEGNLSAHPLAELITEIGCADLSGSLKLLNTDKKAIIYFESGNIVYVVSNERAFRLAAVLVSNNVVDHEFTAKNADISNDLQLSERVVASGCLSQEENDKLVAGQCEAILSSLLKWNEGEWIFSPHSRLKSGVSFNVHASKLLFEYSRDLPAAWSAGRLENQNEWFAVQKQESNGYDLSPKEAYILSRFDAEHLTLGQLISICGLPEDESLPIIYSLWLGGFITRDFWHSAISDKQVSAIRSATLELKRPAIKPLVKPSPKPEIEEVEELTEPEETTPFDLETDLARIESASSYYEVLGVDRSAKVPAIRKAYFRLAKQLHPDRYHSESTELFQRIEKAFTELAQAHETLRNVDSRQGYDIRLRQTESERTSDDATVGEMNRQEEQAAKDFDRGFTLQLTGNLDEAMPYLARAVHYSPDNAKYHAYYGKSLASDHGQRHKAESELSTAVRLEPQNETFRLMLAEFFIRWRLMKRAEGELRRLLDLSPNNQEAHRMLDSLQAK